ncbi:hypothetical protein DYQ93_12165 [Xanthomonas sp. LMG 8992]|uniref:hypothetical protein n=1 Tax=Xanthomonas sp. LMG 8992 TaxID=1591157 RepID=UPI00136DD29E|nr:hypothetical protein [Xanthomonas sp. LMG 8992]MXV11776.1 hypothetical protein [Xanthomonas sp. LMG 8992]
MAQQEAGLINIFIRALDERAGKLARRADTVPTNGSDQRMLADLMATDGTHWVLIEFKDAAAGIQAEREKAVVPDVCQWLRSDAVNAKAHDRCHFYAQDKAADIGFWRYRAVVCSYLPLPKTPAAWSDAFIGQLLAEQPQVGLESEDFLDYTQALLAHTTGGGDGRDVVLVVARAPGTCHHFTLSLPELVRALAPSSGPSMKL